MSFEGLLTQTCTIQRDQGNTRDSMNNLISNFQNLATNVPCLLDPGGGEELVQDGETVVAKGILYLKFGQDITEKDRVIHGGKTYDALYVENAAGQNHHLEVDVKLVGG